jgi:hypothetical protein
MVRRGRMRMSLGRALRQSTPALAPQGERFVANIQISKLKKVFKYPYIEQYNTPTK